MSARSLRILLSGLFVLAGFAGGHRALAQTAAPQVENGESYLGQIERKQRAIAGLQMDIALAELEAKKAESLAKRGAKINELKAMGDGATPAARTASVPVPASMPPLAAIVSAPASLRPATQAAQEPPQARVVSISGIGDALTAIVALPTGGTMEMKEKDDLGSGWSIERITISGVTVRHAAGARGKLPSFR